MVGQRPETKEVLWNSLFSLVNPQEETQMVSVLVDLCSKFNLTGWKVGQPDFVPERHLERCAFSSEG